MPLAPGEEQPMSVRPIVTVAGSVALAAVLVAGASYLWSRHRPHVIEAVSEIHATPAEVWQVLAANDRYPEWNPSIIRSDGRFEVGGHVTNTVRFGDGTMTFTPEILAVEPGRELRWVGRTYLPLVADGEHGFVLEEVRPGVTRLVQREEFTGVIVPFASGLLAGMDQEFADLNDALARRVEAVRGSAVAGG
ncbi:SRPBCC domain-containing protein [Arsenicicoccus sp. MKL-02]|uniref:SRPBCC domain-containing protein n=2 Tax=Arsenicicoccus cauae TaxID=2663847 RepID=A0A6I3IGI7_9MICO|nr:SRPBCC domain-containing protein [Arsenicicoccus cauae]